MVAILLPMIRLRQLAVVAAGVLLVLGLAMGPAMATEGPAEDQGTSQEAGEEAGGGERSKISFPDNPRDQAGLVILGIAGVFTALAAVNAVQQLRGRRPQATGEWRWR